jgi:hypothetical protein
MSCTADVARFEHESHLPEERWPRPPKPAPRFRGGFNDTRVKAVNSYGTLTTYSRVPTGAPAVAGSSWMNLDLCGGW